MTNKNENPPGIETRNPPHREKSQKIVKLQIEPKVFQEKIPVLVLHHERPKTYTADVAKAKSIRTVAFNHPRKKSPTNVES